MSAPLPPEDQAVANKVGLVQTNGSVTLSLDTLSRAFEIARAQGRAEPWPISVDGPHEITKDRRWLARQMMDSKLSDEEALGIVAHHPAIRRAASPIPTTQLGANRT